uniref:Uncharacterized protein n=1 Tax=Noctiluca scintillans TaxID=2966 RepID=A0A7S1B1P5_NOCSC
MDVVGQLRSSGPIHFDHRLRVCNAYPYSSAINVYRGADLLTEAMPYKTCQDLKSALVAGDKLDFKIGSASAGVFSVSDLPNNDAVLLLIIHRHDGLSSAAAFESHVFANLLNSQVAVFDTYSGSALSTPEIVDERGGKSRSETLRFNSVVAVNKGMYEVKLKDHTGVTKAVSELVALNHESYVVIRTGVEAHSGQSYPEDLIVFPQSSTAQLSGAQEVMSSAAWLVLFLALFAH